MTMPDERLRALKMLKAAAMLIFERGAKRPKLKELRQIFRSALKHYPSGYEFEEIANKVPKLFSRSANDIFYDDVPRSKPSKRKANRTSGRKK